MDEMTFTLHNPLTEEEWDTIEDVDFDHTNSITFHTKHGKEVVFVKRKTGRWILSDTQRQEDVDNGNYQFICSECGKADIHSKAVAVSFCWNCGARMEA